MSGLFDQITNYSPPLLTAGQVNYKGTWDASANSPALVSPPAAISKGDYYVVSVAGTQFSITFAVGDWIISNGTAWEKVDLTDAVSSVFGRTGAVVGASTDYSSVGLTNTAIGASSPSTGAFTTVTASSTIAATGAVTGSNLSGTNTGDQTNITGNAATATALQTPRAINGVNFDGTSAITVTAAGSTLSDTVTIAKGGTGQITAQAALNALLPSQAGASGKNLQSDGTNVSFVADAGGTVTSVSVSTANGVSGTVATSTTTPAISLTLGAITPTSVAASGSVTGSNLSGTNTGDQTISITGDVTAAGSTGVLTASVTKINGTSLAGLTTGLLKNTTTTGVPTIAVSGTDYAPPTSGTAILYGNNAGGFNNVTVGSGLSFSSGTLASTSAGGSVTSVSVTTANGVSGTVTNPSTTPDISLTLGAITPSSVNSVVLSGSATPTLAVTGTSSISGTSSGTNTGDQTISITGDATASGSTGVLTATVSKINGTALSGLATGILKNTTTTGVPSIAVAADFPTLNQNTTGSAATLTTARGIYGNNFDGSAALTQVIASTYGGTGNGFAKFSGPASSEKTFTLPNANATLLYDGGALGTPASGTVTNLTGTASININGTVGATTASTGAFTTLSATGTITGGDLIQMANTANANRINIFSTVYGLGIDSSDLVAYANTGAGFSVKIGNAGYNSTLVTRTTSTGLAVTGALSSTTGATFATSSGDVGIGMTPVYKLDVTAGNGNGLRVTDSVNGVQNLLYGYNSVGYVGTATNHALAFNTNGSERLRIDTSGNVGIGVTPSAWATVLPILQVSNASFTGYNNQAILSSNWYYNAGNKYIASAFATQYSQSSGQHIWFTAASGTAGNAITFTQAMTLDASGQLGIGTTSPSSSKLHIVGDHQSGNSVVKIQPITALASSGFPSLGFYDSDGTRKSYIAQDGSGLVIETASGSINLTNSGNVGIGTASPAQKLHVNSSSATVTPITTTSVTGDTAYQAILVTKFDNDSTTSQNFIQFQINNGGANCGKITANGANTAAFGSTSDRRVKEKIADLPSQLANIMALRPVEFDYVESLGGGHQIGFVAQEMQQVYPDVIAEDSSEEKILSITGWSKTEARLVKALQELNANLVAQVAALSQRISALETK